MLDTALLLLLLAQGPPSQGSQEPEAEPPLEEGRVHETVDVIAVSPVRGLGVPRDKVPANVQILRAGDWDRAHNLDFTDLLNRHMASFHLNDVQNNPFQPDVTFRGFSATPLLGTPQGLAVYQDGVRLNEPFGDVVNWDLIPQVALDTVQLLPGPHPVFGLNTLGGVLSLETKNGFDHAGQRLELGGGSFGRTSAEAATGGSRGELGHFVGLHLFREDSWRDFSPSEVGQGFGALGWRGQRATVDMTLTAARNQLDGNGPVPVELLRMDRQAVFTHPDRTENRLVFPSLRTSYQASHNLLLEGVFYYRDNQSQSLNGDDADFDDEDNDEDEGTVGEDIDAVRNRSRTDQSSFGGTVQGTFLYKLGELQSPLVLGLVYDRGQSRFDSAVELAELTPDRGTLGLGRFDPDGFTDLTTRTRQLGVYATTTLSTSRNLAITLAGRYNRTQISLNDEIGTALDGDHEFRQAHGALGATYRVGPRATVYVSLGESSRAPSPVELTCADPQDPCRLPNSFLADPPLDAVLSRSLEAGGRGRWGPLDWRAGIFASRNEDDLFFISSGRLTNAGHFANVGTTQRQGLEINLEGRRGGAWTWFFHYTFLAATFENAFRAPSPQHPLATDGEIAVRPGDRIPGLPEHQLKLGVDVSFGDDLSLGVRVRAATDQFFRGDEANLLRPISGYTVSDLHGRMRLNRHLAMALRVTNLFDEDYETFGLFGEADDVLGPEFDDPRFLGPGAPRAVWLGVTVELGGQGRF